MPANHRLFYYMKAYFFRTNWIIRTLFPNYTWRKDPHLKKVYLTFDDGPTPAVTPWVIDQLNQFDATAAFFCIGQNIDANPEIFDQLIKSNHLIGNHTDDHCNGWKTSNDHYIESVKKCSEKIRSKVNSLSHFRPPYGKITAKQADQVRSIGYSVVMWEIISGDYDTALSPEKCLENVLYKIRPGSIIVFHDSVKAFANLEYVLPRTLQFLKDNGYEFGALTD